MRTLRKTSLLAFGAALALLPHAAFACAACSGQSDSAMAKGMNAGIYAMLAMVGVVLSGASTFFVFLARRSSAVAKAANSKNPPSI